MGDVVHAENPLLVFWPQGVISGERMGEGEMRGGRCTRRNLFSFFGPRGSFLVRGWGSRNQIDSHGTEISCVDSLSNSSP